MEALIIVNIIITFLFLIFCLLYLSLIVNYIFNNFCSRRPKIVSYWLDYFFMILSLLCSSVFYVYYQIKNYSNTTQSTQCLKDYNCLILTQFICFIAFLSLNSLLFDNIQGIMTCLSIAYTLRIKADDIKTLNTEIGKHSIMKTSDKQRHIIEFIIFALFYIGIIYLLKGVFDTSSNSSLMLNLIIIFFSSCEIVIIILTFGSIYALSKFKTRLLDRNYYSKNKKLRSIYQIHASRMAYFDDFITYKSIIDLVGNIPMIMFASTGKVSIISLWISYFVFCSYIFFNGSILAYIDRKNKVKAQKFFFGCFRLDYINFSFGHMEKAKLYDENCLDIKCDDAVLINELNLPLVESDKLFDDINISLNTIQNDYLQVNFYLILRLIFQYFKTNEQTFMEMNQASSEHLMKTLSLISSSSSVETSSLINKVTNAFVNKFKKSLTFSEYTLLSPIENKRYSDEFSTNFKLNIHSKVDLKIESLETDLLLQLHPYYNINIGDILLSLDAMFNKQTILSWYDSKIGDKTYNYYSTHDSLLSFEIYEPEVFSEEKLGLFSYKYSNHILEKIHLNKKTFIPFVLGIFVITYSYYKKYVVLYRNSCVFSRFLFFNSITLSTYSEREEQVIIKFNNKSENPETEKQIIQNNMRSCEDDMTKLINDTLTLDIQFIKEMQFLCFPKVNVMTMNETTTADANEVSSINEMLNKESIKFDSVRSNYPIMKRSDFDVFTKGVNHKLSISKMENGSSVLTSVDLVNLLYANGKRIVFKIFFSELFRITVNQKLKENFKNEIVNNRSYCKL